MGARELKVLVIRSTSQCPPYVKNVLWRMRFEEEDLVTQETSSVHIKVRLIASCLIRLWRIERNGLGRSDAAEVQGE